MNINDTAVRKIFIALFTLLLLAAALMIVGPMKVLQEFQYFPVWSVTAISCFLVINLAVVTFRLSRILAQFGINLSAGIISKASVSGHLAGLLVVSIFGQVIGRHLALRHFGVSPVFIATLTAYERVLMVVVSGSIGISGAYMLLSETEILTFLSQASVIEMSCLIVAALAGSFAFGKSKFEHRIIRKLISRTQVIAFLENALITVCAQALVLSSFVIGVLALHPDANIVHVAAASAVISFAASMPVTVNGWGVRELVAVYTLGLLGIPSSSALAVSILVGLCSTFVILAAAPIALRRVAVPSHAGDMPVIKQTDRGNRISRHEIEKVSAWVMAIFAAVLIFFQMHVQLPNGVVNINLADPFALLALAATIAQIIATRTLPNWKVPHFNFGLAVVSVMIIFALLNGILDIGVTQWALLSRGFGWLVLLGYLSIGYQLVSIAGVHGLRRIAETIILTAALIVLFQIVVRWLSVIGWIDLIWVTINFEGYSGNRNAFAFQLLASSVLALSLSHSYAGLFPWSKKVLAREPRGLMGRERGGLKGHVLLLALAHGVVLIGIMYTGSLGGLISGIALLSVAFLFGFADRRFIVMSLLAAGVIWAFPYVVIFLANGVIYLKGLYLQFIVGSGVVVNIEDVVSIKGNAIQTNLSNDTSHALRWGTITHGLRLWWESPLFGAGLGAFIDKSVDWFGLPVVIHSTPVWILTEFGLVGLGGFLWVFSLFVRYVWGDWKTGPSRRILVLLMLVFCLFSLVHEIFYQRVFWLVLGGAVAFAPYTSACADRARRLVCHIITSLNAGGAERMLARVVSTDKFSHDRRMVVSLMDEGVYGEDIKAAGVELHTLNMKPGVLSPMAVWRLIRLLIDRRPDVVITWLYHADMLGFIAAKIAGVRRVYWNIRCSDMSEANRSFVSRLLIWLLARLSPLPSGIIANSHEGMRFHKSLGYHPKEWQIISNGVDMKLFQSPGDSRARFRREIGVTDDVILVGHLARYHPMKDHRNMLEAAALACRDNPDIHFVMAGHEVTGQNDEIAALIRQGGLEGRVHLLGSQRDIPQLLSGLDMLALSSAYGEGTPNVIVEAMAAGLPCVVTNVGDAAFVVDDAGIVVPPRDFEALARGILELAGMPPEQRRALGAKAQARVAEHFTIETVIGQYQGLISGAEVGYT